jgi:uncharacterized repeat protein (TIGR03803 family)
MLQTSSPSRIFGAVLLSLLALGSASATGQNFRVLYAFAGPPNDGSHPATQLLLDAQASLFGVTGNGGAEVSGCNSSGCGVFFELTQENGSWTENALYSFYSSSGTPLQPNGSLVSDSAGNVYGIQGEGGDPVCNCGAVFEFTQSGGVWTQTILHSFVGGTGDGSYPFSGLVRDAAGNIYGATADGGGGPYGNGGVVFGLTPNGDGTWSYRVFWQFEARHSADGMSPSGPMAMDSAGNLYGTTSGGGVHGWGTVYELSNSGGTWNHSLLFTFPYSYGHTSIPSGLVRDSFGNLFGATAYGGPVELGTVFMLTQNAGSWRETILHTFTGREDGGFPDPRLVVTTTGIVYGTASNGGSFGYGNVFKLELINGRWTQTILHDFTGKDDGAGPSSGLTSDGQGNLYGVTYAGGAYNYGVAYEITP